MIKLKYLSAYPIKNSDKVSNDFLSLNNCGAFIDTDKPIITKRPNGRMDFQLIYISRGTLEVTLSDKNLRFGAGTVILFRPHEPQIYRTIDKGTSFYWIHFSGSEASRLLDFYSGSVHVVGSFHEFEDFCNDAVRAFASGATGYSLYCCGRLISLVALLSQKSESKEDSAIHAMLEPAIVDMHTHFTKARSNDDYARLCGLSKSHFIRTFHECMKMPPQKYRTAIIIREAKHLLKQGIAVSDVSDFLGFSDQFYFSRIFKKHTGFSPCEYKKTHC